MSPIGIDISLGEVAASLVLVALAIAVSLWRRTELEGDIAIAVVRSLVQLIAPNEMRGRVMSLYMVAFRGGMPLGSLVGGWLATMTSAPTVLTVNGLLLSAVAIVVLVNSKAIREL